MVFENIYVFFYALYQPIYHSLFMAISDEGRNFAINENKDRTWSNAKHSTVKISVDIARDKHENIRNYFTLVHHNTMDTFYFGHTVGYLNS